MQQPCLAALSPAALPAGEIKLASQLKKGRGVSSTIVIPLFKIMLWL